MHGFNVMTEIQRKYLRAASLLVLIFLSVSLYSKMARSAEQQLGQKVDWTELAFKKAEILGGHATPQETLDMIDQMIKLGHLEIAREIIEKGPELPEEYQAEYRDSTLALETAQYFNLGYDDPSREQQLKTVQSLLQQISTEKHLGVNELTHYLRVSEQLNIASAVITYSRELAEVDTLNSAIWWNKAGQWSKAQGQKAAAVQDFFNAYQSAQSEDERLLYKFNWLRALQADNQEQKVIAELNAMLTETGLAPEVLEKLALFSLEIEHPDLAWRFYGCLAETDQSNLMKWQEQTVRWALAARQPLEAALLLGKLATMDMPAQQQIELLQKQLELLLQGDRPDEAVNIAATMIQRFPADEALLEQAIQLAISTEEIEKADTWNRALLQLKPDDSPLLFRQLDLALAQSKTQEALDLIRALIVQFPGDKKLLTTGVDLAISAEAIDKAEEWNNQLLEKYPTDPELLKKQAEISMARRNVGKAVESIRKLYKQNPEDLKIRRELSQLEEWSGNPETALEHWLYLSQNENDPEIQEQIYRLSRMLNEYSVALESLNNLENQRQLTVEEVKDRIQLYEIIGEPDVAIEKTRSFLDKHPQEYQIWLELAHLLMRSREYRQALKTWDKIVSYFGRNEEETMFHSECYWRLGEKKKALEVVESYTGEFSSLDSIYHTKLLVGIGWRYHRPELVGKNFENLLNNYDTNQYVTLERLIYLQRDAGKIEEAVEFAIQVAQKTEDPRFLRLALNLIAAGLKENQIAELLDRVEKTSDNLDSIPLYWIIKAQTKYTQGELEQAEECYQRALSLDVTSLSAQEGVLWSLLALKNKKKLNAQLNTWEQRALRNKELWLVYAISRQYLGQFRQACVWYELLIENGNRDYNIILGYADVLEKIGAADRAYRLRLYAMRQLRPEALAYLRTPSGLNDQLKSYVTLLFRYGTAQQREYWLQTLQRLDEEKVPTQWLSELAVSWYLSSKQHDQARIWLAKAHEQRISTPYWQELLLALENNDQEQLLKILEENTQIDLENKVAILQKLNRQKEASSLAEQGVDSARLQSERSAALLLAAGLKPYFPRYVNIGYEATDSDALDSDRQTISGYYSLKDRLISLGTSYHHVNYESAVYRLKGIDKADDLSVTLHAGQINQGATATLGVNAEADENVTYGYFEYYQRFGGDIYGKLQLALQTIPEVDSILQPATVQDRLDGIVTGPIARNYYYYLDLWGREYKTRSGNTVAKGYGATTEVGFKQQFGRFGWMTGLQGNFEENYDREIPYDLGVYIPPDYTVDDVIAEEGTSLLVGGRIGRGDIREAYPSAGSFRYFASAWVGNTWPQNELAANVKAGVGFRMLGNDELSLKLQYNQSGGVVGRNDGNSISIQYTYYF